MKYCFAVLLLAFSGNLIAQTLSPSPSPTPTQCSDFNSSTVASTRVQPSGTQEHSSGSHSFGITPVFACKYTAGTSTICNTECDVTSFGASAIDPIGASLTVEEGTLTALGTHQVSGTWVPGVANAAGAGTSCQGTVGGGATNCFTVPFTQACFVSVSISAGGVTVSTNGTKVWESAAAPAPNTCAQHSDPAQQTNTATCDTSDQQATNRGFVCEPLIIDLTGEGFHLTDTAHGVVFDILANRSPFKIPWTADGRNGFLVLDRNGNGVIDDSSELFGNLTPQPASDSPNGFLALAMYDTNAYGGNGDGVIDAHDQIFSQLRIWVDSNHDGISQPGELHTLPDVGVFSISLDFSLSRRTDEFGNVFRYKAKINQGVDANSDVGKKIYDVFFLNN